MTCLAIIPARGGSKRVPNKNKREIAGLPLVKWTLLHASMSPFIDECVLTSDDDQILSMAPYPFKTIKRPLELATDSASSYDVIKHAYYEIGQRFDLICLLQPTSPLRLPIDIDVCVIKAMTSHDKPGVATAQEGESVPNGSVYVGRTDWLLDGGNFDDSDVVLHHHVPANRSVDIDTQDDWDTAEDLLEKLKIGIS